ncbi:MAG: type II toxin-antitoxin system HicB family antitoxin [Candidatus Thiosymbion ectosymbiont of Robbea hypermnestra]|nr:type II toxin-antitoxin system HicB family antitoxin [Candidatus Thiosymbion ectosymbiont of Robbea hypermnestra]
MKDKRICEALCNPWIAQPVGCGERQGRREPHRWMVHDAQHRSNRCNMKHEYTAVIKEEDDWWIGWIEEIPGVNCQEKTYDELKDTLEVTLKEALEFNPKPSQLEWFRL